MQKVKKKDMAVLIKNKQRKVVIENDYLKKNIQKVLAYLEYPNYDIGLWITTNATIRKYNKQYRERDKATSILSFSFHPKLKPGKKIRPKTDADKNLGDLIISAEFIKKDAPNWNQTFNERLNATIVHGICHLLGYTHKSDQAFGKMQKKERELLALL
ncbi:TPA: rRNA maturation RNase YbeY [Candidatus Dependentiae bacterium]|nr:MAG: hypothetical protein US03_C0002G0131 [candidate division TM6 bacterium GW2011_GWF2_36_131]KKQ03564.1 MAG: hypothetical protein US13_C0002G0130 [candidate division TM6 bacterium GW2011_GWE2_36_25]KKQ20160.1 MAG: hypothetical protein US32_C0001G0057 [candidate division TM6 bacterium GW2011_GWA2_36_9]HBR70702.1 rRNA maturation RNase YbeY [Candidatus Dependentiae bacterium]HCU00322.1 rRNA maturation RNase YbeY [Candidatus Dependentiae bacterium]